MKTILDYTVFKKAFKRHCIEQHIDRYFFSVLGFAREDVFIPGDMGDEVFDATYGALEDIGLIDKEHGIFVSPYDVLKMEDCEGGMTVKFKPFCQNFGGDCREAMVCEAFPVRCKHFDSCCNFFNMHNKERKMDNETIKNNDDFNAFMRYVGGNQNLIDSIHDIERDPKDFSRRMMNEIEKFGLSYDTEASELRCELIGYLLLHKEDAVGFELGKRMFKHKKESGEHHGEVWILLMGEGLQRILDVPCQSKMISKKETSTREDENNYWYQKFMERGKMMFDIAKRLFTLEKKYAELRSAVANATGRLDIVPETNEGNLCVKVKEELENALENTIMEKKR